MTMISYDAAEVCELLGLYIMSKLLSNISKVDMSLYRDDGVVILGIKTEKQNTESEKI